MFVIILRKLCLNRLRFSYFAEKSRDGPHYLEMLRVKTHKVAQLSIYNGQTVFVGYASLTWFTSVTDGRTDGRSSQSITAFACNALSGKTRSDRRCCKKYQTAAAAYDVIAYGYCRTTSRRFPRLHVWSVLTTLKHHGASSKNCSETLWSLGRGKVQPIAFKYFYSCNKNRKKVEHLLTLLHRNLILFCRWCVIRYKFICDLNICVSFLFSFSVSSDIYCALIFGALLRAV